MLSDLLKLVRLSRLFDAAFPLVGLFLGAVVVGQLDSPNLSLLIFVVVILNSVAMIWNDIEDKEVDRENGRPELAKSNIEFLRRLKTYIVVLIAVSFLLAWIVNITALIIAVATVCIIWIYNSKPIQASHRPIMSIVILSGAGAFLPYLFGLSIGAIDAQMLIAGLFWWCGRISLSVLKDYKDARGDARHRKKTFLLCYGARKVALVSVCSLIVGYAGFVALSHSPSNNVWGLSALIAGLTLFVYMRRALFNSKATYSQLDSVFRKIAQYQLLLDVGVVLWLI